MARMFISRIAMHFTKPGTNYTEDGFFRWDFAIGIACNDTIVEAKDTVLQALKKVPLVIENKENENFVFEDELATSTVNRKVFFRIETKNFRKMALIAKGHAVKNVKKALEDAGFYTPAEIHERIRYGGEPGFPMRVQPDKTENQIGR